MGLQASKPQVCTYVSISTGFYTGGRAMGAKPSFLKPTDDLANESTLIDERIDKYSFIHSH